MTGSLNSTKIIAWLFLCNAIVRYAENNVKKILTTNGNISLEEVLNYYRVNFPESDRAAFLSDYLIAYYKKRCATFKKDMANGDRISEHEILEDKVYKFTYQGISSLV